MDRHKIQDLINNGENSGAEFKRDDIRPEQLAKEIVAFLKEPASYGRLGAHVPKGVRLVGPRGTGKT